MRNNPSEWSTEEVEQFNDLSTNISVELANKLQEFGDGYLQIFALVKLICLSSDPDFLIEEINKIYQEYKNPPITH